MKSYKNCFELEGGSSYRGFELQGVTDCLKFLSDRATFLSSLIFFPRLFTRSDKNVRPYEQTI